MCRPRWTRHVSLRRFVLTRVAFARLDPAADSSPASSLVYATLRLPAVFGTSSGVPLPAPTLAARASFLSGRPVPSRYGPLAGDYGAAPLGPLPTREQTAPPRLLGRPLSSRRGPSTPSAAVTPCPSLGAAASAFQDSEPLGSRDIGIFGADTPGSDSCLPTHQPPCYQDSSKADYRPAGLSFGRAGFAPAGRLIAISWRHRIPPIPRRPALPGRNRNRALLFRHKVR